MPYSWAPRDDTSCEVPVPHFRRRETPSPSQSRGRGEKPESSSPGGHCCRGLAHTDKTNT